MNSLEQFFHTLYNYDLAKERNRKKGRSAIVKSPKLTMNFDFPDVDPPIVNAPHEILYDVVEEEPSLYNDIRFCTSSPNCSFISDEVTSEDVKMTDSSIDDMMTSESDYSILSQTTPNRTCYHPKHKVYEREGLTTNTFVKITKNLAPIVDINDEYIICRGCMKQTHQDIEYTSHQDYIAPKKAKKEHILNNLKIDMVGFNQREKRVTRSHPYKRHT